MSRRAMRRALLACVLTWIAGAAAAYAAYRYALSYPDRPAARRGREVDLVIPRGAPFPRVMEMLSRHGLVRSPLLFRIYANYKGQASKVRAGRYRLRTDITPRRLLDVLVHGVPAPQVTVTIPEGSNMLDVARILAGAGVAPRARLVAAMRDVRFLRRVGVPGDTMEGFMFPDTYRFRAHSPPREALARLFRRHQRVYHAVVRRHPRRLRWLRRRLGWGHLEIVTLASIVEKETGRPEERPLIAGVFLNRMTLPRFRPRLLQTDPTIIYGCTVPEERSRACRSFRGRIRRVHLLDRENPYNTYTHTGLPPGPIANPGRAAIEAVLAPARTRFLYFVSKNDGTHAFSATRAEHERAVDRYQRRRRATGGRGSGAGSGG